MKNGSIVYHCQRTSEPNAEIETFSAPIRHTLAPRYLTIQPNTGNTYESTFGEYKDYSLKMCGSPYEIWDCLIKEGDKFYVDKTPENYGGEEPEFGWGYDADYRVVKVAKQNRVIYFALKSVVEDE